MWPMKKRPKNMSYSSRSTSKSSPMRNDVARYFRWNRSGSKIRRPKSEHRKKPETRNPNTTGARRVSHEGVAYAAFYATTCSPWNGSSKLCGFGTRIYFGFRPSDFGFAGDHSTAVVEETRNKAS